jgi:hypothetical protein
MVRSRRPVLSDRKDRQVQGSPYLLSAKLPMDPRRQVQVSACSVTSLPRSFQIEFRATSVRRDVACVTKVERNEPMEFSVRLLIPILVIANFSPTPSPSG